MATSSALLNPYKIQTGRATGGLFLQNSLTTRSNLSTPVVSDTGVEKSIGSNNGGFLGGLGYLGHKLGLGVLSTIEGIWDYAASGVAKLAGADEWAERQVANDWVNYNAADEWFDPGTGWKVAGDVSSGIGTSLTSLVPVGVAAAITVASGGTLSPVAAQIIAAGAAASSVGIAGGGAAGNAVKEAYQETGELTGKEYAYGTGVGALEGVIEGVSNLIGVGTAGRAIKELGEAVAKGGAKAATKTAVKSTAKAVGKNATKNVLRQIGEDFMGEAVEEAISEWASPYIARATYDPNAENATAGEIAYAAIVGGISGAIMSGGTVVTKSASNYAHGNKLINDGKADQALTLGKYFAESEQGTASGISSWQQVSEIYNELKSTVPSGTDIQVSDLTSTKQKMLLGALSKQSAIAVVMPEIERSAINLVMHPEQTVQTLNEYGKLSGSNVTFTAEQLLEGVDTSDLNSKRGYQCFRQSLHRALSSNGVLTRMAVADATGRLTIDTMKFSHARAEVLRAASATDLNRFREEATQAELDSLGMRLGISNWDMLTNEQFHAALDTLLQSEQDLSDYTAAQRRISEARAALPEEAKPMPHTLRRNMNDGVYRFEGEGVQMAILKEGESYYIVDYDTGYISRKMTVSEVNRVLKQVRDGVAARTASAQVQGTENISENADENARLALAENGKKRYNGKRRYLQISKEEYAVISARIMADNADAKARGQDTKNFGCVSSANYFYVYENLGDAAFGVTNRVRITDKNIARIKWLRQMIGEKNGVQSDANGKAFDRSALSDEPERGYDNHDNAPSSERRGAETNDALSSGESSGNDRHNHGKGVELDADSGRVTSAAIGVWARENVPGYDKLADPAKTAVRATIRQARAFGISEENIKLYASVAARSGLNVVFDVTVQGDALYDGRNTIYVDPNAPIERMRSKLLLHEGGHALFARTSKGRRLLDAAYRAIEKNNPDRAKKIRERYEDHYAGSNLFAEILEGIIKEEQGAAYLEDVLGEVDAWSYILAEDPQYENKLISFFAKAAQDYKRLAGMPAEARKLLRQYKKLFAELSAYNQGNNALDTRPTETKKAVTSTNDENAHDTGERAALDDSKKRFSQYDEIRMEEAERNRVQSEALTWDTNHRNEMRMRTLSNGVAYQYVIDDEGIVHIYDRYDAVNIHEWRKRYDNKDAGQSDWFVEELRPGQGNDGGDNGAVSNGRESSNVDQSNHRSLRSKGHGDRTGDRRNAPQDHKRRKPREYHFDDDGSGHGTVTYSEEQYSNFGWVRENNVLSSGAWRDFENKFAAALHGQATPPRTSRGEFMIAVSNIYDPQLEGINNAIVYATGTIENPRVSRVLKIDLDNETQLDEQRRNVYALERRGIQQKIGRIFHVYTVTDFRDYGAEQGSSPQVSRHNDQLGTERGGSGRKAERTAGELLPVVKTFSDISGKQRNVLRVGREYMIEGDSRSKYSPTIEAAIEAENRRIVKRISKEYGRTESWVRRMLENDPAFFDKNGAELVRFALSEDGGKAKGQAVTMSKGEIAKLHANYAGEKVFDKKSVTEALSGIDAFQKLSPQLRRDFIDRVWTGYNQRLHKQGFELFTEVMWHQLHATILQEGSFAEFESMTESEITAAERKMDEQIVAALRQIVASGKPSIKAKLESATSTEGYRKQANYWKAEHDRAIERNKLLGRVKFEAEKLSNLKAGRYVNAANYRGNSFSVAITELAKINWRGGLVRDQKIRQHFASLAAWYVKDNPLYKSAEGGNELFRADIKEALDALGNAQNGALTNEDLLAAEVVIKYFAHEVEAHNTIYKNGKRVDAMPEAKRYIENVERVRHISARGRLTRSGFARMVADPATLMRQADGYQDGFFTEQFEELRRGTIDANVLERELSQTFENFWSEHKSYGKRYNSATVTYQGKQVPLQEALSLYMTMKREQAYAGLAGSGFEIDGKDGKENVSDGFADKVEEQKKAEYKNLPPEELLTLTKEGHARIESIALQKAMEVQRKELYDQFTDEDKELISIMEKTLEQCRDVKVEIDQIVQGYSNVTGGYYFPIKRTGLAENVDAFTGFEGDRVSNLSINKDTVKNAHKLYIEPVHIVFMRHLKAVSLYHGLGVFTDNFNRLYNLNVNGPQIKNTAQSAAKVVVDLSENAELKKRIASSTRSKYDVIRRYLIEQYKNHTFTLSDGRRAIMDNSDAQKLSRNANESRTAQLGQLRELVERARYDHSAYNIVHDKFVDFHYYEATAKYNGEEINLWINVGVAKNDGKGHVYAITNKKEDAPAHYGVGGPVGNRIQNASSTNSISQNGNDVNLENNGAPLTIRDALGRSNNYTKEMLSYFKELKQDVEGISKKRNAEKFYNDAVAYIRSTYATYQLGANPKVWVTQLSSLIAASNILDADCIVKGVGVSAKGVDEYCRLAWLRNNDNAAAMAQAVSTPQNAVQRAGRGALQKVRDVSMLPIGKVDRFVVTRLFAACQVQVEKNGGAKIGTEANKKAAGKLLTRVILETQQNSLVTERSAAMRSGDELLKGSTMFSADAMKVGARLLDAAGEYRALNMLISDERGKGISDQGELKRLEKRRSSIKKQAVRATAAIVGVALFNAALAYGFKWLYRRDEDEDLGTFFADTVGNMLGGIPFVRDAWGFFQNGFEMDHFLFSTINDLLGVVTSSYDLLHAAVSGEEITRQQALSNMRKVLYAAGQLTGVPVRNIYNVSTGMINRVSPKTGTVVDGWFYQKNYRTALQRALDEDDHETAAFMLSLLLDEQIEGGVSENTRTEMLTLLKDGYSVLPRSVPTEFSYEGETFELDEEQQAAISAYYATLPSTLDALLARNEYQRLTAEQRAMAYDRVYDVYRELGISYATGANIAGNGALVASAIGVETYALSQVVTSGIRSDVGVNGKAVAGSKRKKTVAAINTLNVPVEQKLLLICARGYSLRDGDLKMTAATAKKKLLRYILALKVSKAEKMALAEMCGFEVKNGRIVTENAFK